MLPEDDIWAAMSYLDDRMSALEKAVAHLVNRGDRLFAIERRLMDLVGVVMTGKPPNGDE